MTGWAKLVAWPFLRAVYRRFNADEGTVIAGYIAYAAMLAGMPFLIFAVSMGALLIGAEGADQAVEALFQSVPSHVAQTLEPVLREVIGGRSGGIATLSLLGTVWAASNGVEAIRIALDRAYDVRAARSFVLRRVVAVVFVFVGFFTFAVLAVLIIFAPLIFRLLDYYAGIEVHGAANIVRYLVGAGVLLAFLWASHRLLPSRNMAGFRLLPGIVVSVLLWGLIASAMSVYLAHAPSYTLTYGALAGVIVTLLFFYLTAIVLIFGGEVNAELNAAKLAAASGPDDGATLAGQTVADRTGEGRWLG
ncbi:MAG: YihY/virulence factor BrkB family protein [Pseudomonadota bacterium]